MKAARASLRHSASALALFATLGACGTTESTNDGPAAPAAGTSGNPGNGNSGSSGAGAGAGGANVSSTVAYLSPTEHLTRASIALRGLRPTRDELEAVREDPTWLPSIVDYYLSTPEFGAVIRELHDETLLTGVDPVIFPAGFPPIGALAGRDVQDINTSIVQAPARLAEHVVMNDRPYSELVTADYTVADDVVATVWGLPYDANGEEWQETRYADDRPHAGILSDSFLFTRHSTTYSNKNRGRANLISRSLLCYDFLSRELPVDTGIDLADPAAVANAVENNGACVSCHQTLDPLAAYFAAFYPTYVPSELSQYPFSVYEPTFAPVFRATEPGFFGIAAGDLSDLGATIADDPRFSLCAAKRFYSFLAQVDLASVPESIASDLQGTFIDNDLRAKALAKAVVLSDAFRTSHALQDEGSEELVGLLRVRPSALARIVEQLTGYRWRTRLDFEIESGGNIGGIDLMEDAFFGFEVLAGGMDGVNVTRPSHTTSATVSLVTENLAARAARHVVSADFAQPEASRRYLLRSVEAADRDEAKIRAQLVELQLVMFGETVQADDPAVDAAFALFAAELANSNPERAWELTLFAMLQDARLLHY